MLYLIRSVEAGVQIITCEQIGRICYSSEIDPKYTDVIVKRFAEYKGNGDDVYLIRNGEKVAWKDIK